MSIFSNNPVSRSDRELFVRQLAEEAYAAIGKDPRKADELLVRVQEAASTLNLNSRNYGAPLGSLLERLSVDIQQQNIKLSAQKCRDFCKDDKIGEAEEILTSLKDNFTASRRNFWDPLAESMLDELSFAFDEPDNKTRLLRCWKFCNLLKTYKLASDVSNMWALASLVALGADKAAKDYIAECGYPSVAIQSQMKIQNPKRKMLLDNLNTWIGPHDTAEESATSSPS